MSAERLEGAALDHYAQEVSDRYVALATVLSTETKHTTRLKAIRRLQLAVQDLLIAAVVGARADKLPWRKIGESVETSAQAAQQRFGARVW